jgi:pimeloyl-ACP methyl ester carboxylesterase
MKRIHKGLWLVMAILIAACQSAPTPQGSSTTVSAPPVEPTLTPTPAPTAVPTQTSTSTSARFITGPCQFPMPAGKIDCGTLIVPEDRAQPNGPLIHLPVAIVRSSDPHPAPDPVVVLNGGPGGYTLDYLAYIQSLFADVLLDRDLIVFDQRGVGYATPSLNCPEVDAQYYEDLTQNLSAEQENQHLAQVYQACQARLIKEGRNLAAYTTAANAADVNDLRLALGYPEWNVYGISYGTRLALTVMRDFPQGVRSVILDSTVPPQVDFSAEIASNAERAVNLLFERCAANVKCNSAYPDFKTTFDETVTQLDTAPITLTLIRPKTGTLYNVVMNGDRFIYSVFQLLYNTSALPFLPELIDDIHRTGRAYTLLDSLSSSMFANDYFSEGMYASVECGEATHSTSSDKVPAASASAAPRLREIIQQDVYLGLAICEWWKAQPADAIENQPVVSDIPTLILAGDNDPVTPPAWGQLAAQNLSRSQYFEFPWVGHGVLGSGIWGSCSQGIAQAFLTDPHSKPDSACLSKLKPFFVTK